MSARRSPVLALALALAAPLAGCGSDGPPQPPAGSVQAPSHVTYLPDGTKVTVSGEATVGVVSRF